MIRSDQQSSADTAGLDEQALIRQAQDGDLDAFNALYERYLPLVYRRVRCVIPESDVEDVTQDIFVAVVRSLKSFRGNARFSTWLRTLVNRRVADYYRRHRPPETGLDPDSSDMHPALIDHSAGANPALMEEQVMLRRAINALPEDYRDVLLLRFAEGLQFNEIAALRGQSLEATKSLFRRAVSALRKQLEETHA